MNRMPPESALEKLLEGNARYVQDRLLHPDRNSERREAVSAQQEPFAVIVGCSDSRVPPEIIFDQGVGDLFVVRVAGNVVGPVELDSIGYSVKYLHSSVIIVLGHERCGAVTAVLDEQTTDIETVSALIRPVTTRCKQNPGNLLPRKDLLDLCIRSNAENTAKIIRNAPLIRTFLEKKLIDVVAGYYELDTGMVRMLRSVN